MTYEVNKKNKYGRRASTLTGQEKLAFKKMHTNIAAIGLQDKLSSVIQNKIGLQLANQSGLGKPVSKPKSPELSSFRSNDSQPAEATVKQDSCCEATDAM